jgi:hypothetical protein
MIRKRSWKLFASFLVVALHGCGPGTASVTGRVTFQDKPLTFGRVTFFGENGFVGTSEIRPDGSYTIVKIPVGQAKITVETPDLRRMPQSSRGMMMDPARFGKPDAEKPGKPDSRGHHSTGPRPTFIPPHYGEVERSGLSLEIHEGENKHDIPLK